VCFNSDLFIGEWEEERKKGARYCVQRFLTAMYSDLSIGEWEEERLFLMEERCALRRSGSLLRMVIYSSANVGYTGSGEVRRGNGPSVRVGSAK
jgi:hypothetical protein